MLPIIYKVSRDSFISAISIPFVHQTAQRNSAEGFTKTSYFTQDNKLIGYTKHFHNHSIVTEYYLIGD